MARRLIVRRAVDMDGRAVFRPVNQDLYGAWCKADSSTPVGSVTEHEDAPGMLDPALLASTFLPNSDEVVEVVIEAGPEFDPQSAWNAHQEQLERLAERLASGLSDAQAQAVLAKMKQINRYMKELGQMVAAQEPSGSKA